MSSVHEFRKYVQCALLCCSQVCQHAQYVEILNRRDVLPKHLHYHITLMQNVHAFIAQYSTI